MFNIGTSCIRFLQEKIKKEKKGNGSASHFMAGMRGGGNFRRAGSWPLAFRHWPTRLNNRRYVIAVRVCRQPRGKGGKSANGKQRRSKKVARDECREAGRLWRSITYVRESVTPCDEDALFFSSSTSLLAPRFEQTRQILDNVLYVEVARVNDQGNDSAESRGWIRHANISMSDTDTGRTPIWSLDGLANVGEITPNR